MKKYVYGAALLLLAACSKENHPSVPDPVRLVPLTFSVHSEPTKTSLGPGNAVVWSTGDAVTLLDDVTGRIDGTFAVVDGAIQAQVSETARDVYALYPADAEAYLSGSTVTTSIPSVQEAVEGSFAEAANVAVAYTTVDNPHLTFQNACALLKFTLEEEGITSVTILGNEGEKLSGAVSVTLSGASISAVSCTGSESVTLKKADGSALTKGATYYAAVAPQTLASGITMLMESATGTPLCRKGTSRLVLSSGTVKSVGSVTAAAFNDLYTAFMLGATLSIAGVDYNKSSFAASEIVALDSGTTPDIRASVSGKKGIFFLSGTDAFTYTAALTLSKELVLVSRYTDQPVTLRPTRYSSMRSGGSLVLKNMILDCTSITDSYALTNNSTTGDFSKLHLDGCFLTLSKNFFAVNGNSLQYGINSIRLAGCHVSLQGDGIQLFNAGQSTCLDTYKDIQVKDNVIFSESVRSMQVMNYANNVTQSGTEWDVCIVAKNNIFYNLTSANGLFRQFQVASLEIGGNIYYCPDHSITSKSYYLFSTAQDKAVLVNNGDLVYGLEDSARWVYSGNANGYAPGVTNTLANEPENPFDSFDTATGAYTLKEAYQAYGPQL